MERPRDANDERVVGTRLAEAGKDLHVRAKHIPACVAEATGMSEDQLTVLVDTHTSLQKALTAD